MPSIGKRAILDVVKETEFGLYLDGEDLGEILLPIRYVPDGCTINDRVEVFIYLDSDDRIIAITEEPFAEVGECAHLKVTDVNSFGAFMDWGLPKDLFAPFNEQRVPMEAGRSYTIYIFEDNTGRISASSKLSHFLKEKSDGDFAVAQDVDLHIATRSPLGYKAVVNGTHLGLIHNNDVLIPLTPGQKIKGYIKKIRPDGAIDLLLQKQGRAMEESLSQQIMVDLEKQGGVSTLTDRSSPEEIFEWHQVSKANYKKALGQLYKEKKILIEKDRIVLLKNSE